MKGLVFLKISLHSKRYLLKVTYLAVYSLFTQWPRFRVKYLLMFCAYNRVENYFVIEPKVPFTLRSIFGTVPLFWFLDNLNR
jgi:hypothetical protein